jgi:hypothetical protein
MNYINNGLVKKLYMKKFPQFVQGIQNENEE